MRVSVHSFNGILDKLYYYAKEKGDIEEDWAKADVLVVWQDVVGHMAGMCKQAKEMGKKVVVAEHGLLSINDYIPPLSKPLIADYFMAWGKESKDTLVKKANINPNRIKITGSTIFENLGPRIQHEGKRILFNPRHWGDDIKENHEVSEILKGYDKAYVYTKIIMGEHDPFEYPNPIISQRNERDHLKLCYDALKEADVVVGIGEGTFAALAYWMDIPYISVDNWETKEMLGKVYDREEFNSQISNACKMVKPRKLLDTIEEELENPDNMKEFRKFFVQDYLNGGNPEDAFKRQLEVIYEN